MWKINELFISFLILCDPRLGFAEPDPDPHLPNFNFDGSMHGQADVGVPDYLPQMFKNEKYANIFSKSPGIKSSFSKTHSMNPHNFYSPGHGTKSSHHNFDDSSSMIFSESHEFDHSNKHYGLPDFKKFFGSKPSVFGSQEIDEMLKPDKNYKGDCLDMPRTSANAILKCGMSSECTSTCIDGYQFPHGETKVYLKCNAGEWEIVNLEWTSVPACEPICLPPCQNNGICIAPGECDCPNNFNGPQCQYENKPCLNYPPLPKNSKRSCSQTSCTISCASGHQFPDGSSITNLVCKEGNWVSTRSDMAVIPNCQPTCNPPCKNGGVCLSLNVCQCPKEFRGPQCEYSVEVCTASKMGFNGGYNCSGDANGLSCVLSCPVGIKFTSNPATKYTCLYSSGVFMPQPIPQCIYGNDDIITMGGSSHVIYKSKSYKTGKSHSHEEDTTDALQYIKTGGVYSATKRKHKKPIYDEFNETSVEEPDIFSSEEINTVMVEHPQPKPSVCFTWGGAHFKTFDGNVYSFNSDCRFILVRDAKDNTFSVTIQNVDRKRRVSVFLQDKEYTLEASKDGSMIFKSTKRQLPIPAQLTGLRVEMAAHMVQLTLEFLGVTIKWNGLQFVQVGLTESMWNRTEGLCGIADGNMKNDILTKEKTVPKTTEILAKSWQVKKIGDDVCEDKPSEQHACAKQSKDIVSKAEKYCNSLVSKPKFAACSKIMDISSLLEACKWDYCGCPPHLSREACGCDSLAVYSAQCVMQGVTSLSKWRDEDTCMVECSGGRVYKFCGPSIQLSCGSAIVEEHNDLTKDTDSCTEGCFCPEGTLYHEGKCVTKDQCPCRLKGKQFPPGSTVPKDCNTCTCQNGEWVCSQATCGSRCSAIGDPHYQTFDGKRYNFMGQCSYTLLKTKNFTIEAENVGCPGTISEAMNLKPSGNPWELSSCTKSVTIKSGDSTVHLKQGGSVVINGKDVTKLPIKFCDMIIRTVSSLFVKVEMPQGIDIWWDGMTRVHIDAPPSFHGKTKGLCGTFNANQKDDFLTPEGDVEQSIIPFANKWKTGEKCDDSPNKQTSHPCEVNIQNKATAEKLCEKLKSRLFEECHWSVDVEPYYDDCLYDMCSCEGPIERCFCPILGSYASECALQGIQIQWRYNVKECEVHCPAGQTYQICGDSCARSCHDISGVFEDFLDAADDARCRPQCVEGCNCPPGQALDDDGECIPIGSCPCRHAGLVFPSRYKEVRAGMKEQELCTCIGAKWECRPATPEEVVKYPRAADIKDKCIAAHNEEFTTCEPSMPLTCKNMHEGYMGNIVTDCHPGCQCKKGFVLDSVSKTCVKPKDCPCHHGGRSYADGQQMQEDCNTCKCKGGKWECEKRPCPGVCSTWGDSHFRTFDGRYFDFQGVCTYLLTKGNLDTKNDAFSVEIQNEVCGTSGVTCSKSVTLKVGTAPDLESITFTKDKPLPFTKDLKRIKIRSSGLFLYAEIPHLGVVLQWDKGTRVYVKVDPKWKGRMKGLCGNYNENEKDDFQTPSSGVSEASARLFGDSWKLQPHCPRAQEVQDTCNLHPERKTWAVQKCSVLKRYPFSQCHTEVPPDEFQQRCERDTCACGSGGDCECLCTALAAYAHECASRGVPIKWRSQELCPMQCDETCSNYSPCVSACPVETCENTLTYKQITTMCTTDTCIEGCERNKKCPSGHIYVNATGDQCIPRKDCKTTCMVLDNGRTVLEGEIMEEDDCHTCRCSLGKKVCKGQPCSTIPPFVTGEEDSDSDDVGRMLDMKKECKPGWTEWMSKSQPEHIKASNITGVKKASSKPYSVEKELIPTLQEMYELNGANCLPKQMVDIQCRTVNKHISAKETGLNAECSLENGLFCRQPQSEPCPDFEIRILCECGFTTTNIPFWITPEKYVSTETFHIETTRAPEIITTISPELSKLICDSSSPNQEHPDDCAKFLHCAPGMGPKEHPDVVVKTCGPDMLYNPKTMTCDWPATVIAMKPDCEATGRSRKGKRPSKSRSKKILGFEKLKCEKGKVWSECAKPCKKACLYYYLTFLKEECKIEDECIPGCVNRSAAALKCGEEFLWRDEETCVALDDCTCRSRSGKLVKPGEIVKESECEYCQCIRNEYSCDQSMCANKRSMVQDLFDSAFFAKVEPPVSKENYAVQMTKSVFIERSTKKTIPIEEVTAPLECQPERYTSILWNDELPLGDDAFAASSSLGSSFLPKYSKLNGKSGEHSGGSWSPEVSDASQFIQVKLKHPEPIFGIIMQGSPIFDQYVTSYKVMTSNDGVTFKSIPIENTHTSKIFKGPSDSTIPMKQMFEPPVEAKYVKVIPLSWHDSISIRFDLIGCGQIETTTFESFTVKTEKLKPKKCVDPMGIGEHKIPLKLLSASSHKPKNSVDQLDLMLGDSWQPLTNSPGEWIMVNFTGPRNLTGIITKGGPNGWVTSYAVLYSPDAFDWNPVVDDNKKEVVFTANYDKKSEVTNYFDMPISGQYIKILPKKWHENIQMRVEPLGCFKPYPEIEELEVLSEFTVGPEPETTGLCNICKGVQEPIEGCDCVDPHMFDGEKCVPFIQCPCIVNHVQYPVGSTYETEDCQTCTCKLGGIADCVKKTCPKCDEGSISSTTFNCHCTCTPCPDGKKICPTSDVCIPEELWCNGVKDCPDDEQNCEVSTTPPSTAVDMVTEKSCPVPNCPKGYKVVEKKSSYKSYKAKLAESDIPAGTNSIFGESTKAARKSYMRYYKGGSGGVKTSKGGIKTSIPTETVIHRKTLQTPTKIVEEEKSTECPQWRCVSSRPVPSIKIPGVKPTLPPCPAPKCPPDYNIDMSDEALDEYDCPKYNCIPPQPRDKVCNVTCRSFNTFDGTNYQYDLCDHVLARDMDNNAWDVTVQKNCTKDICINEIVISQDRDQVRFRPDLSVEYNGYMFTIDQTRKIGFNTETFIISRLGTSLFFVSSKYGFWVIYDNQGNIKLGVSNYLLGHVDGLCGFYNGKSEDDMRTPDGSLVETVEDFGNSWQHKDNPQSCTIRTCPISVLEEAKTICYIINKESFNECQMLLDMDLMMTRCVENVCNCLQDETKNEPGNDGKVCRCDALQMFVTDCLAADPVINLPFWRTLGCPCSCEQPLIHNDCYKRSCELTCGSLFEVDPCPITPGVCFSGCFCPEGLIRNGDDCVEPHDCRNCECQSFGNPQYVTFDKQNFTFDGKCAYTVMKTKDSVLDKFKFDLYAVYDKCTEEKNTACTSALYLVSENNTLLLKKTNKDLIVVIDDVKIIHFPVTNKWVEIQKTSKNDLNMFVPHIHVELSLIFKTMAFSVKIPPSVYYEVVEGLCGTCTTEIHDTDSEVEVIDPSKWRAPPEVLEKLGIDENECIEKPKKECEILSPSKDPCFKIMDQVKFGKCHLVVDPAPYLASCQQDLCVESKTVDICRSLEAYALDCRSKGICLDWRRHDLCPYQCKHDLKYDPCHIGCQITCDNHEKYAKTPEKCTLSKMEGCFCSDGKILVNNTCIKVSKCFPCDDQGHFVGDKWKLNDCTECTCPSKGGVTCTERSCAQAMTCSHGFQAQQIAKPPGQCCPEFVCVPIPTQITECPDPVKINCGFGQVMKLETMSNNCVQYICKCKPPDECDPIDTKLDAEHTKPGMVKEIDKSGCCPKAKYVCKEEKCPKKPKCQSFHEVKTVKNKEDCCPKYTCEPPKDKCLYDIQYEAAPMGGEKKRDEEDIETIPKAINAIWQDGPCRSCVCSKTSDSTGDKLRAVCSVTQCPKITSNDDFIIESVGVPFSCCPQPKYKACKQGHKTYEAGETWTSDTNPCESYICASNEDGTLEKQKNIKHCNDECNAGWKYVPSENPEECCGECIPFACIVHGMERQIGEEWTSDDFCTSYICLNKSGTVQVQSVKKTCPKIHEKQREEYEIEEISIEGECCKRIVPTACKSKGKIYKIGDEWPSLKHPCRSYKCISKEGTIEKRSNTKQCETTCIQGWKYVPSPDPEKICCGECVPYACIVNGEERKIGEEWSSKDHCTNYFCLDKNGTVQVSSVRVSCPTVTDDQKKNYEFEEIPVEGQCCKKLKPVACKVDGKIHKVDDIWQNDKNPCESFKCVSKSSGAIEKQTNVKHCDEKCKPGLKYVPSKDPKVCCGECVPFACVVNGVEHKIGEEWTSDDHCTNYFCLNKNGLVQVQSVRVNCPTIPEIQKDEFEFKETPVIGKCCKKIEPIACKVNGEIYKEGSTWRAPDGDPCKNITCIRDLNGELTKKESIDSCNMDCPMGWEYKPTTEENVCCGQCVQIACVVEEVLYKPDEVWYSPDKCTKFSCEKLGDQLLVTSNQDKCPDIAGCDPDNIYVDGCCKHCNITAMAHSTCTPKEVPVKETIGLVTHTLPNGKTCTNTHPLHGFRECVGSCNSGTLYNKESSMHVTDCKCCQAKKYDGLTVEMTCDNGQVFKKQIPIPTACECQACTSELLTKTKTGRKIPPKFSYRQGVVSDENLNDDVELL